MTILAISDRPPRKSITEILSEQAVDLICLLGDLEIHDLHELKAITHIPKIGVYGNHDSGNYFEPLGIRDTHLKTFEYQGTVFGGFEGSVRYKDSPYAKMYTQEEAMELLKDFPRVDVMLSHAPPYGINDEPEELAHQGFKALRTYLEEKKPKYLLHGHTYPSDTELVRHYQDTEIVYVYQDKLITI